MTSPNLGDRLKGNLADQLAHEAKRMSVSLGGTLRGKPLSKRHSMELTMAAIRETYFAQRDNEKSNVRRGTIIGRRGCEVIALSPGGRPRDWLHKYVTRGEEIHAARGEEIKSRLESISLALRVFMSGNERRLKLRECTFHRLGPKMHFID